MVFEPDCVDVNVVAVAYDTGLYRLTTKYSGGATRGVVSKDMPLGVGLMPGIERFMKMATASARVKKPFSYRPPGDALSRAAPISGSVDGKGDVVCDMTRVNSSEVMVKKRKLRSMLLIGMRKRLLVQMWS